MCRAMAAPERHEDLGVVPTPLQRAAGTVGDALDPSVATT